MSKSQIFLGTLISFCLGIGIHSYFSYNPNWYGVSAVVLLCLAGSLYLFKKTKKGKLPARPPDPLKKGEHLLTVFFFKISNSPFSRGLGGAFLLLTFLSLGLYRGQSTIHIPTPGTVDFYTTEIKEERVTLQGIIAEEPDVRRDKINYTIRVEGLEGTKGTDGTEEGEIPVTGYTLISAGKYPKYEFGDQLKITGNLQKPVVFDTFDYAGYLSRFDIYSVMYRPRIVLEENSKLEIRNSKRDFFSDFKFRISDLKTKLFSYLLITKSSFESHLNLTYPTEPTSSFMAGLLLGSRKGMPEELTLDFQTTGLTHIVAISGYNITLVVSILMAIFKPFGKRISILLAALGVILFTLFVGASPAVVRACIMGLIALLALNSERKGNITIILALTASLMIGYNPKILIYDVGFQLSFLATMGLIYVAPILEPYLKRLPKKLAIRDSINLSLSAQIMALPIIVLNFQNLSLISPISNLLVAGPFIPFSMLFGFVGTMVSYISIPLGKLIAFPGYLLLQYIVHMIEFTADIPYAAITISWFSQSMLFMYFIGLSGILYRWWRNDQAREETIRKFQLDFEHRVVEQLWLKT